MNEYKLAKYTPVHTTGETIDFILRELGSDALALYMAYVGISQWQKTTKIKATISFMANRMNWSEERVRKVKKQLSSNGYVKDFKKKNKEHKIVGWYVEVSYLVQNHTMENPTGWEEPQGGKKPQGGEKGTQVLYKENLSAFKENLSAFKEKKVITSENKFSQEIGEIIQLFTEINPALSYSNKTQRKAVLDMIKKFGYQEVIRMTKQTIAIQGEQYAPRVTTPYTMYQKLGDIAIYFKANNNPKILDLTK